MMKDKTLIADSKEGGFSLIELIIVVLVIAILATFALMPNAATRKYAPDDESYKIINFFQEARQFAFNQRETIRVEINNTTKQIRLINEHSQSANGAADDTIVKTTTFASNVTVGGKPANVKNAPVESFPSPETIFSTSTYPLSNGNQVMTFRFLRNGQVVDKGNDNIGTGAIVTGATIYVYETPNDNGQSAIIRAITLSGLTGQTNLLRCPLSDTGECTTWNN